MDFKDWYDIYSHAVCFLLTVLLSTDDSIKIIYDSWLVIHNFFVPLHDKIG